MGLTGLATFIASYTITYNSVDQHFIDAPPVVLALEAAELIGMTISSATILKSVGDIGQEYFQEN